MQTARGSSGAAVDGISLLAAPWPVMTPFGAAGDWSLVQVPRLRFSVMVKKHIGLKP